MSEVINVEKPKRINKTKKTIKYPAEMKAEVVYIDPFPLKKPNGRIDWKQYIPNEYIVLNREAFAKRGIIVDDLSLEEQAELKENSHESCLLVLLAGFKTVAETRGWKTCDVSLVETRPGYVAIKCSIEFNPNSDDCNGRMISAIANATSENTDGVFQNYLERIAENRAFICAVKAGLGINILGADELPVKEVDIIVSSKQDGPKIQDALKRKLEKIGMTEQELLEKLRKRISEYPQAREWQKISDIPPQTAMVLLGKIEKKAEKS